MTIENKIICGNNIDVMKTLPDNSIHMVVSSPPYDSLRSYKGYTYNIDDVIDELFRIVITGGIICWITSDQSVDWSETGTSMKTALKFIDKGFKLYDTMIYEKAGVQKPTAVRYFQCWEYMFIFSKGKPRVFNPLKDRPNKYAGSTCRGKLTSRQKDGTLKESFERKIIPPFSMRRNIWRYATGRQNSTTDDCAFEHPAIFPEKLAKDLILSWSNEGDLILDCFNGSGTTTKMAQELERKFIGIDISEDYCKIARKRLMDTVDANEI